MGNGFSVITYALCKKHTDKVVEEIIETFADGMNFKGSVNSVDDLPSSPEKGDLYIVKDDGMKVVWDGEEWVEFDHELSVEDASLLIQDHKTIKVRISEEAKNQLQLKSDGLYVKPYDDSELKNKISDVESDLEDFEQEVQDNYQEKLVSGQNIKTINGQSVLGSGDIVIEAGEGTVKSVNGNLPDQDGNVELEIPSLDGYATEEYVDQQLEGKQDTLTAGNNISINNNIISVPSVHFNGVNYNSQFAEDNLELSRNIVSLEGDILYRTHTDINSGNIVIQNKDVDDHPTTSLGISSSQISFRDYIAGNNVTLTRDSDQRLLVNDSPVALVEDLDSKQDKLIAGENITIIDNVISAAGGSSGKIGINFTTDITVGHLEAGTEIYEDDTIASILYRILHAQGPVTTINVYYGVSNEIPSDISGLSMTTVEKADLTNEQIIQLPEANNQYCVIATDKNAELLSWKVMGFDYPISFGLIPHNKYNIYYINEPDPAIFDDGRITAPATNYRFKFKEIN